METLANQFFQAASDVFLDLTSLALVRFKNAGEDATATLKFKDGGSETINGEAAINLHQHLKGDRASRATAAGQPVGDSLATRAPSSESVQQSAVDGGGESDHPQSKTIRLVNVVAPRDALFLGRNKAWFYGKDKNGRCLILAFVNAKGSCSVRPFDSETGMALGKRYASGPYQEHFAELIEGATELTVQFQPNLERDCKQQLPEELFSYLRKQIERIPS